MPGDGEGGLLDQLDSAAQLVDRVAQIIEENAGFANEVLQNYEQLNLIFDVTQQIARVTDARAIETLLLQRVARLLACQTVCVVTTDDERRVYHAGEKGPDGPTPTRSVNPAPTTRRSGSQPVWPALETGEAVDFVRRTHRPTSARSTVGRSSPVRWSTSTTRSTWCSRCALPARHPSTPAT